ncbi:MAG: DUF5683 domain-containing protein [Bacteroidota bacterium]
MKISIKSIPIIGVFIFILQINLLAQNDSTKTNINYLTKNAPVKVIDVDGVSVQENTLQKVPSTAALYSAVFPGLGQIYNEKYWKVPLVFAAFAGGIYAINWNQENYNVFLEAYRIRLSGGDDDYKNILPQESQLIAWMDHYRNQRDLSILIMIGIYAFNILDAYVDAHLINFNISNDLSLRVEPSIFQNTNFKDPHAYGLRLSLDL